MEVEELKEQSRMLREQSRFDRDQIDREIQNKTMVLNSGELELQKEMERIEQLEQ